ncbi:MAG: MFS transporter [Psychrobacter sp.]|nr:MFS transporter [Psychrobacter sp.]
MTSKPTKILKIKKKLKPLDTQDGLKSPDLERPDLGPAKSSPTETLLASQQTPPYRLLAVLLTLYFAQGLPSGFITQALPAILRSYDVSLEMIGWSGLLLAPWALKFLWAPIVDRYFSPKLGRARSWILPLQLLSALIVMAVGFFDPTNLSDPITLWSLYALLLLLSLVGATHDVAADGLATRSLTTSHIVARKSHSITTGIDDDIILINAPAPPLTQVSDSAQVPQNPHQGMGNAVQVIGYRLGLILGGGVFLMVIGIWSWQASFFAMAVLIVLNTLPIWCYPEASVTEITATETTGISERQAAEKPPVESTSTNAVPTSATAQKNQASEKAILLTSTTEPAPNLQDSSPVNLATSSASLNPLSTKKVVPYLKDQYGYFWHNPHMRAWLGVLLTYKIVDGISSGMVKPMMVDMGIPTASIGLWASILGSVASLVGAGIAAWVLKRVAHFKALVWFNALQVSATALYAIVALAFEHGWLVGGHKTPFWWAFAANAIEHLVAAMALVAMLTMVMHYARRDKAGSDFTTQVCLLTVFSGSTHLISGYLAEWLGYSGHFILSVGVGVLCLLPLLYWRQVFIKSSGQSKPV